MIQEKDISPAGQNIPEISVIMPVYNSELYLQDAVDSVLKQDFESFELLLVDDGSTDKSPEICDRFATENPRVRVFHKPNGGVCSARNFGLEQAGGTYIAFCDNDDMFLPGLLKDNVRLAKQFHADVVRFKREKAVTKDGILQSQSFTGFQAGCYAGNEVDDNIENILHAGWGVWAGIYRRGYLEKNELSFDETIRYGREDDDFISRVFAGRPRTVLNDRCYYKWNLRYEHSTSNKTNISFVHSMGKALAGKKELFSVTGLLKRDPGVFMIESTDSILRIFQYVHPEKVNLSRRERREYAESFLPYINRLLTPEKECIRWAKMNNRRSYIIYRLFCAKLYGVLFAWIRLHYSGQ